MFTELCTEKHGWYRCNYYDNLKLSKSDVKDSVERVDARTISLEDFVERYEKPFKPVVITHLQDDWLAQQKWTPEVMFRDTLVQRISPGVSCSKLTMSLVNVSLKFQTLILQIHCYFLLKKCENPLHCKGFSHFFNKK